MTASVPIRLAVERQVDRRMIKLGDKTGISAIQREKDWMYAGLGKELSAFGTCRLSIYYSETAVDRNNEPWPKDAQTKSPLVRLSLIVMVYQ